MTNELKYLIDEGYEVDDIADMIAEGDDAIKEGIVKEIDKLAEAADEADVQDAD